jgi:hypothetical protein
MSIRTCGPNCVVNVDPHQYAGCTDPQETYAGCVLATYERNGYNDSDFYAVVWDTESGMIRSVCYGSTSYWSYHNHASVDATPEVIEAAREYALKVYVRVFTDQATRDALVPYVGCIVRSTTTRGKNKGIVGEVKWRGLDRYQDNRFVSNYRVGILVEGEENLRYLPETSCEVVDPEPVDVEKVEYQARAAVETASWAGFHRSVASVVMS